MDVQPTNIRIIWIAPRFPLGLPDGARHATCTLIHHLTELRVRIDLICLIPSTEQSDENAVKKQLNVSSCSVIHRSSSMFLRLPSLSTPFTFRAFAAPGIRGAFKKSLSNVLKSANPNLSTFIVFDGLHPFAGLGEGGLRGLSGQCSGIVYRAHNVETVFWEQCEESSQTPWFRWFFSAV